jgi:hypothetical protein
MATNYATVADIVSLKRPLTASEQERAEALIPVISSLIRIEAKKVGRNFDEMIADDEDLTEVAKGVVCDVVMRELNTPGTQLPATSYSESAGGVSQSYSLPNSSGSIRLWPSDLKTLGLKRQQISALSLMKSRKECH